MAKRAMEAETRRLLLLGADDEDDGAWELSCLSSS